MHPIDQSTKYLEVFWQMTKINPKQTARITKHNSHQDLLFKKYEPKNKTKYSALYSVETKYFEVLGNEKIHELPLDSEKIIIELINVKEATIVIELVTEYIRDETRYFVSTYPLIT